MALASVLLGDVTRGGGKLVVTQRDIKLKRQSVGGVVGDDGDDSGWRGGASALRVPGWSRSGRSMWKSPREIGRPASKSYPNSITGFRTHLVTRASRTGPNRR